MLFSTQSYDISIWYHNIAVQAKYVLGIGSTKDGLH